MNRCFGPLRRSRYIYSFPTCGFFQSSFFAGKYSLKIILKQYFYYLHNNIFKMNKCFLPYLIYMIHPWCVISFCSFSSSHKLKPCFSIMTNLLMDDWSSNVTHFLLLDNFCRICSVCISILRVVSWVDFKFQNKFRNLSGISKTLAKLISIFVWPSNYVLTGVLLQKRR